MAKVSVVKQTSNQLTANYDRSKFAIGNNDFRKGAYTPTADASLDEGLVFGRVSATGAIVPLAFDAADGSQRPVGALYTATASSVLVVDSVASNLELVNKGRINATKLNFKAGTTIDSVIDGQRLGDLLNGIGLVLETSTQLNELDNQ